MIFPQRQDILSVRVELEKDVQRLQEEINALKADNRQLLADKQDLEKQLLEFKVKHDDIVVKLRGQIASMKMAANPGSADKNLNLLGRIYAAPNSASKNNSRGHGRSNSPTKLTSLDLAESPEQYRNVNTSGIILILL